MQTHGDRRALARSCAADAAWLEREVQLTARLVDIEGFHDLADVVLTVIVEALLGEHSLHLINRHLAAAVGKNAAVSTGHSPSRQLSAVPSRGARTAEEGGLADVFADFRWRVSDSSV
jgi:hypothetical protein